MQNIVIADKTLAKGIALIERECFTHPWSECDICDSLDSDTVFLACLCDGTVAGYCGMQITADGGFITNVAVLKNYRKRGIGSALLTSLASFAKEKKISAISLEVRESNFTAQSLYLKHGYKNIGIRKNFYRDPKENAIIMTLDL